MMLPTHILAGMAFALPVALIAPEFAGIVLLAGVLGGILPDLDMYIGHRKTLHYPVYYSVLAIPAIAVAILYPTPATVGITFFILGAAIHSISDVFGGGLELRPWEATSDRAVYDHYRGQWIAPRRWIPYDGSLADLLLAVALALPLLVALEGVYWQLVVVTLAIATVYTAVRRILPTIAVFLVDGILNPLISDRLLAYVPSRYWDRACSKHSS